MNALTFDYDHLKQHSKPAVMAQSRANSLPSKCGDTKVAPDAYWRKRASDLVQVFGEQEHTPTSGAFGAVWL